MNTSQDTQERVVLVDAEDREIGTAEKLMVHRTGALHRAFSVFLLNDQGQLLLQRRAAGKYHSAGLWSNTCCGHPRPGEDVSRAAARRLLEEMGIICTLDARGTFIYRARLENDLVEHELDHLFVGRFLGDPSPDPREADEWRWVALPALTADCQSHPERFTAWLPLAIAALADSGA